MTNLYTFMLSAGVIGCFISMMLYALFNQTTMRKLKTRIHSEPTRQSSGWDVINTARALSLPKSWAQGLERSALSALYANASRLHTQTTTADRILGASFYWLLTSSTATLIFLLFLDAIYSITALNNSLVAY